MPENNKSETSAFLDIFKAVLKIIWIIVSSPIALFVYISIWFAVISITPDIVHKPMFLFNYIFGTVCFTLMQIIGEYKQEKKNLEYEERISNLERQARGCNNVVKHKN